MALMCRPSAFRLGRTVECCRSFSRACFKYDGLKRKGAKKPNIKKLELGAKIEGIFECNKMVVVFHFNDMSVREWDALRLDVSEYDILMRVIPSKISKKALEGTRFESVTPLFKGCTALAFGDTESLKGLLRMTKKQSKLYVLGGILEDQLYTPKGIESLASLPAIQEVHQRLRGLLTLSQSSLVNLLQRSPQDLSSVLKLASEK